MSTPLSKPPKRASFNQKSFDQEWKKLEEDANAAKAKQKTAIPKLELRDINSPASPKKTQDQSAWKSSQSDRSADSAKTQTQTQTITTTQTTTTTQTGPMAHTAPVITPRKKQTRFAETSSDGGPSQEKTSARSEKAVDSPRRTKILQREPGQSKRSGSPSVSTTTTPSSSPAVTPREKDQFESPRGVKADQFRKRISKQFSKVALDLSKINEKLSPGRNSPPSSPGSAGRVSPSKTTPRKKESTFIKSLPYEVRNSAAKCFIKLQKEGNFHPPFSGRDRLVLNAGMIGVLSDHGIKYDLKNLEALAIDAENRSKNMVIDMEVDLSDPAYTSFYASAVDGAFLKTWIKDSSDVVDSNGNVMGDVTKARPTFIRDFKNSTYKIKEKDGSLTNISSIDSFLEFFSKHENKNIGKIVSNIASQNLGMFFKNVLFRRTDENGECQSILRLTDGTPIQPLSNLKATYILSRDSKGNVIIDYELHCDSNAGKSKLSVKTIVDDPQTIEVGENANLTIKSRVVIEPDGEWSIDNPHVYAEFWNLRKGD